MLLALCGRKGAGKSTFAETLAPYTAPQLLEYTNGAQWSAALLSMDEQQLRELMREYQFVDEFSAPETAISAQKGEWVEISFADPIKLLVCALGVRYADVAGRENREFRETHYRHMLEHIGTGIFRAYKESFWIDLAMHKIAQLRSRGINVIVSDVRFENEWRAIQQLGGKLVHIYKSARDLAISDADRLEHPSRWKFLEFAGEATYTVQNNKKITDLRETAHLIALSL